MAPVAASARAPEMKWAVIGCTDPLGDSLLERFELRRRDGDVDLRRVVAAARVPVLADRASAGRSRGLRRFLLLAARQFQTPEAKALLLLFLRRLLFLLLFFLLLFAAAGHATRASHGLRHFGERLRLELDRLRVAWLHLRRRGELL